MSCNITFRSKWVDGSQLEKDLQASCSPHESKISDVRFIFPVGCSIMIDTAVRVLSLFNQLDQSCRLVTLDFEDGESGAMGYLDRMGFFDFLAQNIKVLPLRPSHSKAKLYGGANPNLVEIAQIQHKNRDDSLPTRLTNALMRAYGSRTDARELEGAAWTIFAELIDNIFSHSQTPIDGYAALQVYRGGNMLQVAVSDSGLGIMETLRPALNSESPRLARLSNVDLLVEIFRQGISRHGTDRGCGLKGSAAKAIKYNAELDVRLPKDRILLIPGQKGYTANTAYCFSKLPLLWGTHICFKFNFDISN